MKTRKSLLTLLLTLLTLFVFSQKNVVNIDLNNLDMGKVLPNSVYISTNRAYQVSDTNILTIEVEHLPTLIRLSILKGHSFHNQKLFWVESDNIKIEGSLEDKESLAIIPQSEFQGIADQIILLKKVSSEVGNDLAYTKPYLVHLERYKGFINQEYIKRIVTNLPDSLKEFWATNYLNQYLKDLVKVGFNPVEEKFSYLTAINKENKEQRIETKNDKFILLDFSAPGCVPCLKGIDKLAKVNNELSSKLEIVMIWRDLSYDEWINYAKNQQDKISWNNLLDTNGSIFKVFDINVFPTYILFDNKGKMIKKWKGGFPKNIEKYIKLDN